MRFRVLGPVEVVAADGTALAVGGPKQGTMLATLIAGSGRVVRTDRLLQAMYGEDVSTNSRATMFTYVSTLRRTLGDVIVRRGDGSLLQCADAAIDAVEFEDACRAATALEARIDADIRAGRHHEVTDALTVEHPFREELQAMHMLALYRGGGRQTPCGH